MTFWQYIFRFLYVRNWHTGRYELDKRRLYWFVAAVILGLAALLFLHLLLTPIVAAQ